MDSATAKIYRENFKEISPALTPEEARIEAHRCLYCYDAPCVTACPTKIDIPRFIKQISSSNILGSAKTILEANALGHSCARACPVEVLCEGACVYHQWQERPIDIAKLQRHATQTLQDNGIQPFKPGPDNGFKVAVIGAGPAGAACATYLRRLGYRVTLFEKNKLPGGLNTFGIAEYKMQQKVSLEELERIFALGAELKLGVEVGKDIPAEDLLSGFDAVFIGIGLAGTHKLGVPGEDLAGVWDALSFIRHVKDRNLKPLGRSRTTVVVGAGNTAIDASTQSKRIGTERVVMAYRRGRADMSAYGFELELAQTDGVEFLWNVKVATILGTRKVEGIRLVGTKISQGKLVEIPRSGWNLPCDRVIKAIGQTKHYSLSKALGLKLASDGRIQVAPKTLQTSHPKVFAGGDAINGGKEVVHAAADGKRAAHAIHRRLQPDAELPPGDEYWVSTIEGRRVAPLQDRA
ncbi:MAG: NAD(P)-dependent oxidoreductase [Elusimicrobia bacterium]|nr:NAD(P)-dependent oxidoreductase [Elusimicrobiota bacterium]